MDENYISSILLVSFIAMFLIAGLLSVWIYRESKMSERLQRLVKELAKSRDEVEAHKTTMEQFVKNMSHRIRTPLNSINGFSQLLAMPDGDFTEKEREEFCTNIESSTSMLVMLYDDILFLLDMENDHFTTMNAPCNVSNCVNELVDSANTMMSADIKLIFQNKLPEGFTVLTDERRLQLLMLNCLTNAVERTIQGNITITTFLKPEDSDTLVIALTDTGSTISRQNLEVISSFLNSKDGIHLENMENNSVLELSICKMIANKLGGSTYIDLNYPDASATTDHGARFVLELPCTVQ